MNNWNHIVINKNRGWRGLAEVKLLDFDKSEQFKMIFSFSSATWEDLIIHNTIVVQDQNNYYVVKFSDIAGRLPKPTQQRSVLIKDYNATVDNVYTISKSEWTQAEAFCWNKIVHFIKNKNNHTTSDWNCIGIRVIPEI